MTNQDVDIHKKKKVKKLFKSIYFSLSFKEIINRVRKGEDPPYRPYIPDDSALPDKAVNLMNSCWSEISENRPDFGHIRKKLIDLNGGK